MGKRDKKTAKGRLDKYYHLAKEQGYRARSAFKLIQLNKKYNFLEGAKVAIDLCAAPGGWLQVCAKNMDRSSIILGVDLAPIKPIPGVLTAVQDITSTSCRQWLRAQMHDWRADVVLHDGAPNVGTAWVQDAFTQAELVLHSLKLATDFLRAGGTFVTKVFRSKDYNSLLWVLKQLFRKVEATKPPSSRNVSAEIFLVCSSYLAPKHIDPKLLNPQHVFKDLTVVSSSTTEHLEGEKEGKNATTNKKLTAEATRVFHPEVAEKRRRREGYGEGEETPAVLWSKGTIADFINTPDPVGLLSRVGELEWRESEEWRKGRNLKEVEECVKDLRVLGKKEFKTLLKWRADIRDELEKAKKAEELKVTVEPLKERDEEEEMQEELDRLKGEALAEKRRERRRANERKTKEVRRMQLGMATPMDLVDDQQGELEMFGLEMSSAESSDSEGDEDGAAKKKEEEEEGEEGLDTDEEQERRLGRLEGELEGMYKAFQEQRLERDVSGKTEKRRKERLKRAKEEGGEWAGIRSDGSNAGSEDEESDDEIVDERGIIDPRKEEEAMSSDESASEVEEERTGMRGKKRGRDGKLIVRFENKQEEGKRRENEVKMWYDQDAFKGIEGLDDLIEANESEQEDNDEEEEEIDSEMEVEEEEEMGEKEDELESQEVRKKRRIEELGLITAEALTLAKQLASHEKTASQLIDDGFNRHAFNDKDGMPSWFLEDEDKVFRSNVPVTKEAVRAIREKMRALNARPIKKVAEAKARKKMRTARRVEKLRQKAIGIEEGAGDLTEREKQGEIEKIMKKMGSVGKAKKGKDGKVKTKNQVKVVVAKGANKGQGRPRGVKGKYKMVDPRLKKDARALKRLEKEKKHKSGGSKKTKSGHKLRN
ncbi:FtsJ-domain-containing protein [Atractiella rhizophila]|nr:FtsJ-domain-containing protein [Atractiella rhizophila]